MKFSPTIIALVTLLFSNSVSAKATDALLMAGGVAEDQPSLSNELLFWSKVFILLLIVVFGFLSYRKFRSEGG